MNINSYYCIVKDAVIHSYSEDWGDHMKMFRIFIDGKEVQSVCNGTKGKNICLEYQYRLNGATVSDKVYISQKTGWEYVQPTECVWFPKVKRWGDDSYWKKAENYILINGYKITIKRGVIYLQEC